ncbi:hypothetical protein SNE40_006400 [Patella caerulea]|uniref:non-specific serine/threonine protein kinase n=1 Tax=Patella caerulea TaxID=87958 RepID=A0AAN8JVN3_PATCE
MINDGGQEDCVEQALTTCKMVQFMIDFTAKQLLGLRTECKKTEEITQKEIRDTESKLIKLFSNQLVAKAKLECDNVPKPLAEYPNTQQWLQVAGVGKDSINAMSEKGIGLNKLLRMNEDEIAKVLQSHGSTEEETRTLNTALKNLRLCTDQQIKGNTTINQDWHFTDLSCSRNNKSTSNSPCNGNSPKYHPRPSTSSADNVVINTNIISDMPTPPLSTPSSPLPIHSYNYKSTPPATPPPTRPKTSGKYPSTPPPKKKMQLFPEMAPITKSKSHESQLANRVIDIDPVRSNKNRTKPQNLKLGGSHEALYRRRLSTEGSDRSDTGAASYRGMSGHSSPGMSSPLRSPPCFKHEVTNEVIKYSNTLTVPKSPKTPLGPKMKHQISHRFVTGFILNPCDICTLYIFRGKVCKYCKKKFHKDCASKALPACGMSDSYVDAVLDWSESPIPNRRTTNPNLQLPDGYDSQMLKQVSSLPGFSHLPDSSSTSSCNSSSPSSPNLVATSSGTVTSPSPSQSPQTRNTFRFPDVPDSVATLPANFEMPSDSQNEVDVVNTNTSNDSDKTLIDSNTSDKIQLDRVDSIDSQDDQGGHNWKRGNSLSVTMKEWDIPYEQLILSDTIGIGRFGTVYKGHWHGPVAVKVLAMDDSDNQAQLAAFKLEVGVLRKTRHENLVLFMGACMKPPRLAIVTSFCKGETLFSLIHLKKDNFKLNKALIVASQVAQGMGYLHARGIIHKDLRTKNIFVDAGKVIITDFGLFNVTKICRGNKKDWLSIPPGWLCYLSPEVIKTLHARQNINMDLPFTEMSDLYAFGTVWYELLCGDWPFKSHPAETIIWQVGRGMKQSLNTIGAPREVKDILMSCWAFKKEERPEFSQISKALERIPKHRLIRSPSHPVHLSRSAEVIFNT